MVQMESGFTSLKDHPIDQIFADATIYEDIKRIDNFFPNFLSAVHVDGAK